MELRHFTRFVALFVSVFIAFNLLAFTGLERFVELEGFVNGRSDANFAANRKNIEAVLAEGTRGEILNNTKFPSGNYGLQIKVLDGLHKGRVFWIYYNSKKPQVALFKTLTPTISGTDANLESATRTQFLEAARSARTETDQRAYRDALAETRGSLRPQGRPVNEEIIKSQTREEAVSQEAIATLIDSSLTQTRQTGRERISRCADCQEPPPQCNSKDSYIEQDLMELENNGSQLYRSLIQAPAVKGLLEKRCVQTSQRLFTPNVRFAVCGNNNKHVYGSKPCSSDRLANVVTNSFNLAAKCMPSYFGNNQATAKSRFNNLFKMIQLESGFHLNPVSPEGASGFGQFLPAAVDYINRNGFEDIKNEFANSSIPMCQSVAKEILNSPMSASDSNKCDRTAVKNGNPLKNLIYTIAYFKTNREFLEKEIFDKSEYSQRLNLNQEEKSKLLDALARWTHNSGPGGMSRPLKALILNEFSKDKQATTAQKILNTLPKYMVTHPHPAFQGKPVAAYVSQYYNRSEAATELLEKTVGSACLQN